MTQPHPAASKLSPGTQPLNDAAKLTRPALAASVTPFLAADGVQPLNLWASHAEFVPVLPPEPALQARQGTLVWRRRKVTAEAPPIQQLNKRLLALVTALSALLLLLFRLWHAAQ